VRLQRLTPRRDGAAVPGSPGAAVPRVHAEEHDMVQGPSSEVVQALVDNHRRFLAFLERRVGSRADAEDILQDAFVRGLEKGGQLRDGESAVAWFYRLLRNAVVDHWRRRGAASRAEDAMAAEWADAASPPPDEELFDTICRCVLGLVDTLKPEYAEAVRRIEVDGVAVKDYAAEAGITANAAGVRVHRARQALRDQVTACCGTCATHGCMDCTCGGPRG
jgi:RNA polymerase sigma-70 factor (ECF subfamily)